MPATCEEWGGHHAHSKHANLLSATTTHRQHHSCEQTKGSRQHERRRQGASCDVALLVTQVGSYQGQRGNLQGLEDVGGKTLDHVGWSHCSQRGRIACGGVVYVH
eukprot:1157864-Pelagomonas_calceolata.AAC.6